MYDTQEISKAKKVYESLSEQLHSTIAILENTPVWHTDKCKAFIDDLFIQVKDSEDKYCALAGKRFA